MLVVSEKKEKEKRINRRNLTNIKTTAGSGKDVQLEIKAIFSANILHKDIIYTQKVYFEYYLPIKNRFIIYKIRHLITP